MLKLAIIIIEFNENIMENTQKVIDAMKKAGKALKAGEIEEMSGMDKEEVD